MCEFTLRCGFVRYRGRVPYAAMALDMGHLDRKKQRAVLMAFEPQIDRIDHLSIYIEILDLDGGILEHWKLQEARSTGPVSKYRCWRVAASALLACDVRHTGT